MRCPECETMLPPGTRRCHFCNTDIPEPPATTITTADITPSTGSVQPTADAHPQEANFIDKFVALFTVLALFIALIVFMTDYINTTGAQLVPNATIRTIIGIGIATLLTIFYWLLSPMMIRTIIDPLQPHTGNINHSFIVIGLYFVLVALNFVIFSTELSLITFVILTIIFFAGYRHISHLQDEVAR